MSANVCVRERERAREEDIREGRERKANRQMSQMLYFTSTV